MSSDGIFKLTPALLRGRPLVGAQRVPLSLSLSRAPTRQLTPDGRPPCIQDTEVQINNIG